MNNQKIVLTNSSSRPSIRAFYPELGMGMVVEKSKSGIVQYTDPKSPSSRKKVPKLSISNSVVIRYGSATPVDAKNCVIYNKASAISTASNKKKTRQILKEAGVSIPTLVTPKNFKESYLPIIARPSHHSKCKNLRVLKTKEEFLEHYKKNEEKGWYYSEFINKQHEFRVHCAHGKVLSISEKPKPKNHTDKNIIFGWGYAVVEEEWRVLHWGEYKYKMCVEALKTVDALELDFGAVDIMVKDGKYYVLEVNTAGALSTSPYLRKRYAMYFKWLFSSNKKLDKWDYKKFSAGKSLAWKNKQLSL